MRLLVGCSGHFCEYEGDFYSHHLGYDRFWRRYLGVFDEVLVVARAQRVEAMPKGWMKATGPGVVLCPLPEHVGPWQYLLHRREIRRRIRRAIAECDAYLLRVCGLLTNVMWRNLPRGTPYAVEVVNDPWAGFSRVAAKGLGRPLYRRILTRALRKQCAQASAAAYVTAEVLPRLYPPASDAVVAYYSSVELYPSDILGDLAIRERRIAELPARLAGSGEPVRLGFIGSFSQGHKLPDVHIRATAQCIRGGANVELEMIGEGGMLAKMKALARELGVTKRVRFRGALPGGRPILAAIDGFDLFLNATGVEGLPRVVIEAMARACPCVATDVGGTAELLPSDWMVSAGSPQALAEKILWALRDLAAMLAAARRGPKVARRYCADVLQPRREAFYRALRQRTEEYRARDGRPSRNTGGRAAQTATP